VFEERLVKVAEQLHDAVRKGTQLGIQLYVSRHGEVLVDLAVGERTPGRPLRGSDPLPWSCCTKALGAVAMGRLFAECGIGPRTPVSSIVPEYAQGGKEQVTIAQLMSHAVPYNLDGDGSVPIVELPHDRALALICARSLDAPPGTRALYSAFGSWVVVAEIVTRSSGMDFFAYVEKSVLRELGMEHTLFGPGAAGDRRVPTGLYQRDANGFTVSPVLNPHYGLSPLLPGNGAHGPARDLARIFERLVDCDWHAPASEPMRLVTAPLRRGLADGTFGGLDIGWGLGLCTDYGWFAAPRGSRVAGHTGYGCSFVFGDLDRGLVVSYLSSSLLAEAKGRPRLVDHLVRELYGQVSA
jgi:CubicO group peptidase (beta-lactamase class C family)